jgi:hypothetical protein
VSAFVHTVARRVRSLPGYVRQSATALAALAVLGALVAPTALAAQGGAGPDEGGAAARGKIEVEPRFQLAGSHGYRILVSARLTTVTIGVERGNTSRSGSSTTYVARGVSGQNGIHANFHQFGRLDLTFHATAPAARGLPSECIGGTTEAATLPGYFTGTIDFEGQGGYTSVHSHRVGGEVVLPPTEQCPLVAGGANPLLEDPSAELPPSNTRMTLSALDKSGTGGLLFVARREGKTGFYVERWDTLGRIGLLNIGYAVGPQSSFASNPQVSFGTVRPPSPFSGSATLARAAGGRRTWTGTLAAVFPGEDPVTLVGDQFHTTLSRSFP